MPRYYLHNRSLRALATLFVAAVIVPGSLAAHPDIEMRIEIVTKRIQDGPYNAALYVRRGELHREHRDWKAALTDYSRAAELDPDLATVHLARGMLYLDTQRFPQAKSVLDLFLAADPSHSRGWATRARALVKLGKLLAAAHDFDRAVAHSSRPTPGLYLERARALADAGEQHVNRAILGLEEGMEKLGRIVTLQSFTIELEVRAKRYDSALERLDQIAHWLPKERLLRRQGDILAAAKRDEQARLAYAEAARHIDSLPSHYQSSKPIAQLRAELKAALAKL